MKKFSMILFVVTILAVCLVGATAFASSLVETEENIYIGEYAHDNQNESDPNVVIVYGTASTDEEAGITERGVVLSDGTEYLYYRAWRWDAETGKFGVAIIRSTVDKGGYTARTYAKVGGAYDENEKIVLNYTSIDVGEEVSLNFGATLAQTETDITVTEANSVDLKNYITVTNGNIDEVTYSVSAENGEIVVENGVVSYGNKAGRYTVTATHTLSENSVTFNVMAYDEVYEITDKAQLATLNTDHANSYVKLMNDVYVETADMAEDDNYAYVIDGEFNGFFDGQNNQIKYDFRKDIKDKLFRGVFKTVFGEVKNLKLEGFANMKTDYGYMFIDRLEATGLVENCYINATNQQSATGAGGNWTSTSFAIGASYGIVKDCVFNLRANAGGTGSFARGIGLHGYGPGHWYDIAWISPDKVVSWAGNMNFENPNLPDGQLHNVVYYTSVDNFVAGVGETYTVIAKGTTVDETTYEKDTNSFVAITEAQTMGEAWSVDATGLLFNGELIAPVSNAADYQTTATGSIVFVPDDGKTTEQIAMYYRNALCKPSDFVYSSTNTDVVTVDSQGLVTKVGVGTAQIHVRSVFLNKQTVIPVTVADAVYAVDSAEDLATLTETKAVELGASSLATLYTYLTKDLSITKEDMAYYNNKTYSLIPISDIANGTTVSDPDNVTGFTGVLDGRGYKIRVDYIDSASEAFVGITYKIAATGIIRNLSYEAVNTVLANNIQYYVAAASYGFVDNCFFNLGTVIHNLASFSSTTSKNNYSWNHRRVKTALIYTMDGSNGGGVFRNSIVKNTFYDSLGAAFVSPVISANNVSSPKVDNTYTIGGQGIVSTSGLSYAGPELVHMNNIMDSATFADYIIGKGKLITKHISGASDKVDSTSTKFYQKNNNVASFYFYGTPFTDGRGRMGWTTDTTAGTISMNVDGTSKVVYTNETAVTPTLTAEAATMTVGETLTVTALENGLASNNVRYTIKQYSNVATITQDGVITAVAAGTINVYAVNPLTNKTATISITITAAE